MRKSLTRDFAALTPSAAGSLGAVHLDAMQSAALFEVLYPVKFTIFDAEHGPMDLISSEQCAFAPLHPLESKSLMQLVILFIIIISNAHVHKTVLNTKSGTGAFIKGLNQLPEWLVWAAARCEEDLQNNVHEMIRN